MHLTSTVRTKMTRNWQNLKGFNWSLTKRWRWRRNVSFSISASLSLFSAPTLYSHAHLWSIKLSLKMRVSSNELFSTLKKKQRLTFSCLWLHFAVAVPTTPWLLKVAQQGYRLPSKARSRGLGKLWTLTGTAFHFSTLPDRSVSPPLLLLLLLWVCPWQLSI